jgi:uncharacterized protein HemX
VPPQQQYFLRENAAAGTPARIALLSHDDSAFKADVTAANVVSSISIRTKPADALRH